MYAQYTPSSKRNLSSKILRKSQQDIYKHIQKRPPGKGWSLYIYEKNELLTEFSGKEFSVQTSDMLH